MSDEDALLAAIYAEPDEDTPRLAYADWLDEHGQPERAEFIRVQVELAHQRSDGTGLFERRSGELLDAHRRKWTDEFGPLDPEKVDLRFERGFPSELIVRDATAVDLSILRRLPALRRLWLEGHYELTSAVLESIVALRSLDELGILETEITNTVLTALERLPPYVVLRLCNRTCGDEVWQTFHARRLARFEQLSLDEQRLGAFRALRFEHGSGPRPGEFVKSLDLFHSTTDNELRVLTAIAEVEEISVFSGNITAAGLCHLTRLSKLKAVKIEHCPVDSLGPLTMCSSLTCLSVVRDEAPGGGSLIGDAGTVGLERLTNLQRLVLLACGVGEETVYRLAGLRQLRSLELDLWGVNERCFAVVGDLNELESLTLNVWLSPDALRHFANLCKLQTLCLWVAWGTGEELRHLAGLTKLRALRLHGNRALDAGLRHLGALKGLRTLRASGTAITETGARALAAILPAVTIILDTLVVKSPREAIKFRRRDVRGGTAEFASALLPEHWEKPLDSLSHASRIYLREDGWATIESWTRDALDPTEFVLSVTSATTAETALRNWIENDQVPPTTTERIPLTPVGSDTAMCEYADGGVRSVVFAVAEGGQAAVLQCDASAARFEEFRALFLFIARSLCVGPVALEGVGEEITVPVTQL